MPDPLIPCRTPLPDPPVWAYLIEIFGRTCRTPPDPPVCTVRRSAGAVERSPAGTPYPPSPISFFLSLGGSGGSGRSAPIEYGHFAGPPCWAEGGPQGVRAHWGVEDGQTPSPRNARDPACRRKEKAPARSGRSTPAPRQITGRYLVEHHSDQARLGFSALIAAPRKGGVREDHERRTK